MFRLRELEQKDLKIINGWRNDPELISLLGAPFRYINLTTEEEWFSGYMKTRGESVRCAICEDDNDDILGLVSLMSVDHMNQSAELHIMIGNRENQGRGMGTFAVKEILHHAFHNMNLHRVELTVMENNIRAQRLYEKIGFVREGIRRKARYKDGHFMDAFLYAVLRDEYYKEEREYGIITGQETPDVGR